LQLNYHALEPVLLITPPFTQLNTPYPATAYIKGFLNTKQIESYQIDLGIEVILELFSLQGSQNLFAKAKTPTTDNTQRIYSLQNNYIQTISPVIAFLQGKNPTLARQITSRNFLPEASRFKQLEDLDWAFGNMGIQDKAKHLATLYLEDLSDFIVDCVDKNFGFSRYAERLGRSATSFDALYNSLNEEPTYIDEISTQIIQKKIVHLKPKFVCLSVPFPGNLYSAFRIAKYIKSIDNSIKIAMGGGYPNTELRSLKDARVFEFLDFITLDDGELPLELLIKSATNNSKIYKRTFLLEENLVQYKNDATQVDYKQSEIGTPDYTNLLLDQYISVIEIANPMHSLWSDGRWNKLTMAHGCYWGKCTFCDISLDYIKIYEPITARIIVDRIEELMLQTSQNGFHFVDEAAPPALMREVALEIIRRKICVTWWTNIRFEKSFTKDLCVLLATSGCIAVSGGLEVASDRLLQLIEKGVTVEQVAKVTQNFSEAGIMVHAYLMYGYPTQTVQETVDSLEMVRQLFKANILQSGFWHQFAMTAHSPVGMFPEKFNVLKKESYLGTFANNDIDFIDKTGINHENFSFGLKKSLLNYMHQIGFDFDLQDWFDFKIPKTKISPQFIANALIDNQDFVIKINSKLIWLGNIPIYQIITKNKKGVSWEMMELTFYEKKNTLSILITKEEGEWLLKTLDNLSIYTKNTFTTQQIKQDFESTLENFELFWFSKPIKSLKNIGLLSL
jgi:radical SAM superfamily enzyme YgiQ (UPF0313 family)